jgi:hypothetical protein
VTKKPKLTEGEWERVFQLRCRSKRGERLGEDALALCVRAYAEDRERYAALNPRVFEATKPWGAS